MEYAVKAAEGGCFFLGWGSTDPKKQHVTHVEVLSSSQALQLPQILMQDKNKKRCMLSTPAQKKLETFEEALFLSSKAAPFHLAMHIRPLLVQYSMVLS